VNLESDDVNEKREGVGAYNAMSQNKGSIQSCTFVIGQGTEPIISGCRVGL